MKEVSHKGSDCARLKTINKFRGKYPPVVVSEGSLTWENREPTPDPEEALKEEIVKLSDKMDTIIKQQSTLLEMMAKVQKDNQASEAGGSKAPKKKPVKAKDNQN